MANDAFFQWQNESLLKTIYPLRELKLRDFLTFYQEIDLWAEYKNKPAAELQLENQAYQAAQVKMVEQAAAEYTSRRDYFLKADVQPDYALYAQLDPDEIKKINLMHGQFATYFPKFAGDVRKEKYFVAQQTSNWEAHRNDALKRITQAQRRVQIVVPQQQPVAQQELNRLQSGTLIMAEQELGKLRAFLSSFSKIEKRKLELAQSKEVARTKRKEFALRLDQSTPRIKPLEVQQKTLQAEVNRLKNRPNGPALEQYFANMDVSAAIHAQFPQADANLLSTINAAHRDIAQGFRFAKEVYGKISAIQAAITKLNQTQTAFNTEISQIETNLRNMPTTWPARPEREARMSALRDTYLPVLNAELGKLNDFLAFLNYSVKSTAELTQLLQEKENQLASATQSLSQLNTEATNLQQQIAAIDASLIIPDEKNLTQNTPAQALTAKDIVLWKLETYKAELAGKDHLQLLEDVVGRFMRQPQRYPLWLQYMVIHFSGMRYQSAHGSWADPKELLINLRTATIEKDYKNLNDGTIATICQDKIACYEPPAQTLIPNGPPRQIPLLAQAKDPRWLEKIADHLKELKAADAYHQCKALIELRMDEENYEVQMMDSTQLKDALEAIKDTLPDWMWKEIVKLTDLRVEDVTDDDWENLTPEQEAEKNSAKWAEYRQLMNQWKQDNLTGWREEHDRTSQLIVTRAVCNEVAEHIQHLRGNSPPGGLTAKPTWYLKTERDAAKSMSRQPGSRQPYFVKPRVVTNFTVGASILWLRYVSDYPNPWRIANAITLNNGDTLLPKELFTPKTGAPAAANTWVYEQGDGFKRTRTYLDDKKQPVREQQWLRWIHEATVAEVAETAEGMVVLTFETALPNDDKRLSSIGVFKHYLGSLTYEVSGDVFNASFVGYIPEGDVPYDDLKFMLDWNKILRRQVTP
jgi:hypothetical protein